MRALFLPSVGYCVWLEVYLQLIIIRLSKVFGEVKNINVAKKKKNEQY